MTNDNAHLYIPLLEALRDGELELKANDGSWHSANNYAAFDRTPECYRRKPKPREFVAVIEVDGSGVIYRDLHQLNMSPINTGRQTIRVREVID